MAKLQPSNIPSFDQIVAKVLDDADVKVFLVENGLEPDSKLVKNSISRLNEFIVERDKDGEMLPELIMNHNFIDVAYKWKDPLMAERVMTRPVARYDSSVSFAKGLTFDDLTTDQGNFRALQFIGDFVKSVKKQPNQKGAWLVGKNGIGKTYILGCLAGELMKNNVSFQFIGLQRFLSDLKADWDTADSKVKEAAHVQVLLVDDIGMEQPSTWSVSVIQEILQYRFDHNLPTFFTSNLTKADYCKQLIAAKDVNRTQIERFFYKCLEPIGHEIGMAGENRRKGGQND